MHARIQIYWCRSSIFRHLKLELLTQFPAPNDEKYINVVYIWRKFVSFYGYVHWRMTTEISVMYGSEKVKNNTVDCISNLTSLQYQVLSRSRSWAYSWSGTWYQPIADPIGNAILGLDFNQDCFYNLLCSAGDNTSALQVKRQYILTCKVSRCCLLALPGSHYISGSYHHYQSGIQSNKALSFYGI